MPWSGYRENQLWGFEGFVCREYTLHRYGEGERWAALLCVHRTSVLLVKWPAGHLRATLCACNFHYDFRLSSFSIFSFIVFSYNQGSNRRTILGSEFADKICRPRQRGGLLSHTSYFRSQKCVWGWHKCSLLCDCLWLSSPLRRPENKGLGERVLSKWQCWGGCLQAPGRVLCFLTRVFLMLPLNPTCVSFSHHPHQSPLCCSGFPLKQQWAKGSRHGGDFTTTCSTSHFPGQQCRWMAFRRSLQGHSWSIISRSPIWLCQKQKPRDVMKHVTRPVRNSTLTGKFQGSQKINCNIWLYYHVLRLFLDRRRLVPVLRLQRALTKHRDVCHTPVFQTATLRNRGCQISPCDFKKEKWLFGYILKVPLDKDFKWCYPGKASLNKMDTMLGFLIFFFFTWLCYQEILPFCSVLQLYFSLVVVIVGVGLVMYIVSVWLIMNSNSLITF